MTTLLAFDLETFVIGPGAIAPKVVCGIFTTRNESGATDTVVLGNHHDDGLEGMIEWMLSNPDLRIVTHNGGFDYAVVCANFPRLIPLVFEALFAGRCTDTLWREKLLNLSTTGRLDAIEAPDGAMVDIRYRLEDLVSKYLGEDIADQKNDPESWRKNFETLDGWRAAEYPPEALAYAEGDGHRTLSVYEQQEKRKQNWKMATTATEEFQLLKSFSLQLCSAWGMAVDPVATAKMEAKALAVMEENKVLLEEAGILRKAGLVSEPYARDLLRAQGLLVLHGVIGPDDPIGDWNDYADFLKEHGIKFRQATGKPGSICNAKLQEHLATLYKSLGEIPTYTNSGKICCDAEVHTYLASKDPLMAQYHARQELTKIVGQMIPMLKSGPVVHPSYDAIKETGRTSSYDGGMTKELVDGTMRERRLYPSVNIQQIPGETGGLDPRQCFRPRPGTVFFDVDFSGLELACVGHVTYELFGESVHRDRYNAGVDLHGYLGAQLAIGQDKDMAREFAQACRAEGIISDPLAVYEAFMLLKKHDTEEVRKFWKKYRSFAKPVGLGFPGGLGPATMVEFARTTYEVHITESEAYDFRDMWRGVYPEMPRFFDWINGQKDPYNTHSEGGDLYEYLTPLGMSRRGATFCAAANGKCMQSPGAEAATTALAFVSRACYDPTQESIVLGCRPIAFVHDQIIGETGTDPELWAPQCEEIARLMREGAELVLSSIKMRTDEALLTTVWSKAAQPVRDESGKLIPWTPKPG